VRCVVADLDQAILPDHPVGMENLPDDQGPVLVGTVSYPGRP
jgi:hypothetical protein